MQTYLKFTLAMEEPGGVTSPAPLRATRADAAISLDHRGVPHIPATSLAGALRAAVARHRSGVVDSWFGTVDDDSASASAIWVLGTQLTTTLTAPPHDAPPPDAEHQEWIHEGFARETVEVASGPGQMAGQERWSAQRQWMSTAIDRHSGAARKGFLRQVEFLPAGTAFAAYLRWDAADDADVTWLVRLLAGWRPLLGRGVSAGHGLCRVRDIEVGRLDLATDVGRALWLTKSGPDLVNAVVTPVSIPPDEDAGGGNAGHAISIPMRTEGPLVVGAWGSAKRHTGPLPMRRLRDADGSLRPAIPATSIKGVVRSRMEYILRSIGVYACDDQTCGRPDCLPCQVFGHGGGEAREGSVGRRGRARVLNAFVTSREPQGQIFRVRTHAPIDRFTGGVGRKSPTDARIHKPGEAGGMLHAIEGVEGSTFNLEFDLSDLDVSGNSELVADFKALLRLVVEDLHDGLIGIGHAVNRGYGSVRVRGDQPDTGLILGRDLVLDDLPTGAQARSRLAEITTRSVPSREGDIE